MTSTFKRLLALVAAATLFGLTFGNAIAQDGAGEAAPPPADETAGDDAPADEAEPADGATDAEPAAEEGPKLSEEQMDYVAVSSVVACYNKRVSEADKAKAAIEAFLDSEGLTLDEYQAMEKKFRGDTAVQDAIKAEMDLCDTKVLAMPEAEEPEEELTDEEKKAIEEAEKKNEWTYRKKVYKGTVKGGGISGGRVVVAFQKNGKSAKGNVTGKIKGSGFALGIRGTRKGEKITLKGSSGAKNSATVTMTFKKEKDSDGYEHYSSAKGSFKGKINGRDVSFSFTAKSKKK